MLKSLDRNSYTDIEEFRVVLSERISELELSVCNSERLGLSTSTAWVELFQLYNYYVSLFGDLEAKTSYFYISGGDDIISEEPIEVVDPIDVVDPVDPVDQTEMVSLMYDFDDTTISEYNIATSIPEISSVEVGQTFTFEFSAENLVPGGLLIYMVDTNGDLSVEALPYSITGENSYQVTLVASADMNTLLFIHVYVETEVVDPEVEVIPASITLNYQGPVQTSLDDPEDTYQIILLGSEDANYLEVEPGYMELVFSISESAISNTRIEVVNADGTYQTQDFEYTYDPILEEISIYVYVAESQATTINFVVGYDAYIPINVGYLDFSMEEELVWTSDEEPYITEHFGSSGLYIVGDPTVYTLNSNEASLGRVEAQILNSEGEVVLEGLSIQYNEADSIYEVEFTYTAGMATIHFIELPEIPVGMMTFGTSGYATYHGIEAVTSFPHEFSYGQASAIIHVPVSWLPEVEVRNAAGDILETLELTELTAGNQEVFFEFNEATAELYATYYRTVDLTESAEVQEYYDLTLNEESINIELGEENQFLYFTIADDNPPVYDLTVNFYSSNGDYLSNTNLEHHGGLIWKAEFPISSVGSAELITNYEPEAEEITLDIDYLSTATESLGLTLPDPAEWVGQVGEVGTYTIDWGMAAVNLSEIQSDLRVRVVDTGGSMLETYSYTDGTPVFVDLLGNPMLTGVSFSLTVDASAAAILVDSTADFEEETE
jgi:hypothetical protein